jgi:DHA2 family multidrug resistance protein
MAGFNLYVDFLTVSIPRIILGVGMGFLFIPLTTLTMAGIRKEDMGNATAIYNLLRNLGGSFGVAFVTTMIERRAQFHQFRIVEHLSPFDSVYRSATERFSEILQLKIYPLLSDTAALNIVYKQLLKESSMMAFNDTFYILSIFVLFTIPLVLLIKRR